MSIVTNPRGLKTVPCNSIETEFGVKERSAWDKPLTPDTVFRTKSVTNPLGKSSHCKSDIVSVHLPLTKKTHKLINSDILEKMKSSAILVNTSRGKVVDERDLATALMEHKISAVGLDVFDVEALPESSALRQCKNVSFTPHMGAFSQQAYEKASMEAVQKLIEYFSGKAPKDRLPPDAPWCQDGLFPQLKHGKDGRTHGPESAALQQRQGFAGELAKFRPPLLH